MKKFFIVSIIVSLILLCGCSKYEKKLYLPEAKNDKLFAVTTEVETYKGAGYTINISDKFYRHEKDFEKGYLEECWERKKSDDAKITVTTYKNTDEITARGIFLRENDDYVFEDLMGYSICGIEADGDSLWFNIHTSGEDVYIVSWEYSKNAGENIKEELSGIAQTFKISKFIK